MSFSFLIFSLRINISVQFVSKQHSSSESVSLWFVGISVWFVSFSVFFLLWFLFFIFLMKFGVLLENEFILSKSDVDLKYLNWGLFVGVFNSSLSC